MVRLASQNVSRLSRECRWYRGVARARDAQARFILLSCDLLKRQRGNKR